MKPWKERKLYVDYAELNNHIFFNYVTSCNYFVSFGNQGHHHLPETRGLCLSEEQTVSTVSTVPNTILSTPTVNLLGFDWVIILYADIEETEDGWKQNYGNDNRAVQVDTAM